MKKEFGRLRLGLKRRVGKGGERVFSSVFIHKSLFDIKIGTFA
jgi:hypothetical protein